VTTRVQGDPLQAAEAAPPPQGMSAQDWANFQARYHADPAAMAQQRSAAATGAPYTPPPAGGVASGGAASGTGGTTAANGTTTSSNPGGQVTTSTTNQGTQDTVRNGYIARATQDLTVDQNAPEFRQQADTYAAGAERARRDAGADLAEATAGSGQVGLQNAETRLINERAAQARGGFEADLVRQELQTKRAEVADALQRLGGMISDDQMRLLQERLAELDAKLKTDSLNATTNLGMADINLRDRLGTMGGNIDIMSLLINNDQFGKRLGFDIGDREAFWNADSLDRILRG
jgi:hypothetical protein